MTLQLTDSAPANVEGEATAAGAVLRWRRAWTTAEDRAVLDHAIPDRELAARLGRTEHAIHVRRCRLLRPRPAPVEDVDEIAVERALNPHQPLPTLNRAERREAFALLLRRGWLVHQAGDRLRLSGATAKAWAQEICCGEPLGKASAAAENKDGAGQGCTPTRLLTESPATTGAAMPIVTPSPDTCQQVAG